MREGITVAAPAGPRYSSLAVEPKVRFGMGFNSEFLLQEEVSKISENEWIALALYKDAVKFFSLF